MSGEVRVTFTLEGSELRSVDRAAAADGINLSTFIKQAIADEIFLRDKLRRGNRFLMQKPNGQIVELKLKEAR